LGPRNATQRRVKTSRQVAAGFCPMKVTNFQVGEHNVKKEKIFMGMNASNGSRESR